MRKKKWTAPLLTIIVRGRPEEMALSACKGNWGSSSYNADDSYCHYAGLPCDAPCASIGTS
jgi:hypothetical protein